MVIQYLNKIKNDFETQLDTCHDHLSEMELRYKENKRFIALLEENEDPYYEAFSPRHVNRYQKQKLKDLYEEQKVILSEIENYNNMEADLRKKIKEVTIVIQNVQTKVDM